MIVDLMRNDLSRVCEPGSIRVEGLWVVESYPAVHQLVSTVSGVAAAGTTVGALLEAAFPAGSMTGAPKLSAMTRLHELEGGPRGVYAGCFGYIGADGTLDLAMVIRSILIEGELAVVGAGGGITWGSVAASEVAEVATKARRTARRARRRNACALAFRYPELIPLFPSDWSCVRCLRTCPPLLPTTRPRRRTPSRNKWQKYWADNGTFLTGGDDDTRPRRYVLAMFPYPSGDLHMGHAENYLYSDIVARFWRHRGHNVLNPIGWDSFGLPAENAAIRQGADPREWTYQNIAQQKVGFEAYGVSFDWSRVLHTSDPEYYRWNQWLFLKLYERGLAYRKKSPVNWCPNDQTVLANEQVVDGRCDRCGAEVIKKKLTQWYFRITDYADRLLDDLNQLEGFWPHKVLQMQRNWIGRSVGADVDFLIEGREEPVTVFSDAS